MDIFSTSAILVSFDTAHGRHGKVYAMNQPYLNQVDQIDHLHKLESCNMCHDRSGMKSIPQIFVQF